MNLTQHLLSSTLSNELPANSFVQIKIPNQNGRAKVTRPWNVRRHQNRTNNIIFLDCYKTYNDNYANH